MNINELVKELSFVILSHAEGLQNSVTGGYVSDMLSDVMANSEKNNIWITLQTHPNIVAVASLKNLSGIVVVGKKQPDEETLKKAKTEQVTIMTTTMSAFETAGKIYKLLNP